MDETKLDQLLRHAADRRVSALPGHFAQDVWREIRLRGANWAEPASWWHTAGALFLQPRLLAGSFALALLVSVAAPALFLASANSSRAVDGLGLKVFSSASSGMPSGLLARQP